MKNFKILSWIILWLTWLLTLTLVSAVVWNSGLREHFEDKKIAKQCQEKILSVLKSPSTAQFSNFIKISNSICVFDVDAQNSFWAMIRTKYLCNLDPVPFEKEILEIKGIENIEEIGYVKIKTCITKATLGENFSNCLYEAEREKLREKTCNEAIELSKQWYLSWEDVNNICSSLDIDI